MPISLECPVCAGNTEPLDVVDFNKSCEEARGQFLPLSGVPIYYYYCNVCYFCFAPEFFKWKLKEFSEKIYNADYVKHDPDYLTIRPENNAKSLIDAFDPYKETIRHLDYGGGNGQLSQILCKAGWDSHSFDPFVDPGIESKNLEKFNLITAFEVFEHVPDVNKLISELIALLDKKGLIIFSTLLSDQNLKPKARINWWYAAPRNGHISLYSRDSLGRLAIRAGWGFHSFSPGLHAFWNTLPPWAMHLIKT